MDGQKNKLRVKLKYTFKKREGCPKSNSSVARLLACLTHGNCPDGNPEDDLESQALTLATSVAGSRTYRCDQGMISVREKSRCTPALSVASNATMFSRTVGVVAECSRCHRSSLWREMDVYILLL